MVKVVKKLSNKGFPVHDPKYKSAHQYADKIEKKSDPKAYKEINKLDRKLGKKELAGKHTKSGKIEIEKKFTQKHANISGKRLKKNLTLHERIETKKEKPAK